MSEFDLFKQALAQYNEKESQTEKNQYNDLNENNKSSCAHDNVIIEKGTTVCIECGVEIQRKITHNKEWRYYGQTDTNSSSNPNRVQIRKTETRSIFGDVETYGFSDNIITTANRLYTEVTKGNIFRGNSRKAIVFACVYHAFKLNGIPQSHDKLIGIFNLNPQSGLKGLKYVNIHAKNPSIRTSHITPVNLVDEIMDKFSATDSQKNEVKELYKKIKNKSSKLNRSRPHSIASAVVYYWIKKTSKEIPIKKFTKSVGLSELTITKLAREVSSVLDTPEIM